MYDRRSMFGFLGHKYLYVLNSYPNPSFVENCVFAHAHVRIYPNDLLWFEYITVLLVKFHHASSKSLRKVFFIKMVYNISFFEIEFK